VRLFIVDDSEVARRMLRLLSDDVPGLVVVGEATTGEEALAPIREARPDVVVMDWQMPGINGVEATERLLAEHPNLRVVGFTSSGEPDTHQAFLDAGAPRYSPRKRLSPCAAGSGRWSSAEAGRFALPRALGGRRAGQVMSHPSWTDGIPERSPGVRCRGGR
jgi:DNA-binding NarL/FixJ family response regulator